ncbi:unnamed protein product [Soboliphyme baturini]|uniref:MADS-box domain-containing protein n=1 Tax=Soboliphyme baturini TaxID=241478 RepID=A0A183ICT3_9BILA|nr:unnamed protein product [Soboliphyme baturini]
MQEVKKRKTMLYCKRKSVDCPAKVFDQIQWDGGTFQLPNDNFYSLAPPSSLTSSSTFAKVPASARNRLHEATSCFQPFLSVSPDYATSK